MSPCKQPIMNIRQSINNTQKQQNLWQISFIWPIDQPKMNITSFFKKKKKNTRTISYANIESMISDWQRVFFLKIFSIKHSYDTYTHDAYTYEWSEIHSKHMEIKIFGEMNEKEMDLSYYLSERDKIRIRKWWKRKRGRTHTCVANWFTVHCTWNVSFLHEKKICETVWRY